MIKLNHPDKHSTDDDVRDYANKRTQEINEAFSILKNHLIKR
jgi:curved DNA-binding protein CbpA